MNARGPPVEILNPFRVDIAIEDDPVSLSSLATDVIHDLAENMSEETVVPLAGRGVQGTVQRFLLNCLRINHVRNSLDAVQSL